MCSIHCVQYLELDEDHNGLLCRRELLTYGQPPPNTSFPTLSHT